MNNKILPLLAKQTRSAWVQHKLDRLSQISQWAPVLEV